MRARGFPIVLVLTAIACAGAPAPEPAQPTPPSPQPTPPAPTEPHEPAPLAALTDVERRLSEQLRAETLELTKLGPRNIDDPLSYADATDWVAGKLEAHGFNVERQGYAFGSEVVQNLVVHTGGLRLGREHIVVAARLDSALGSVGSDDNASGVVALLSLVREFYGKRTQRSIDWVWIADASGRRDPAASGSRHFLKMVEAGDVQVRAMVELYGLGAYATRPGSQTYSSTLPGQDDIAHFLGLVTYPEHALVSEHFLAALEDNASLPIVRFTALSDSVPVPNTVHADFLAAGIPAMMVYDTQSLRYPQFGTVNDTPERLDYERMARAVAGLSHAVLKLAGGFAKLEPAASAEVDLGVQP